MKALVAIALAAALVASAAHAAGDCFEPLRATSGWACHADLSSGQPVDFCLERTNAFGADPVSRFFKLVSSGPYPNTCSCRAKGALPGAAFGEDKTFLCLHRGSDTVTSGKISKRRIAGQMLNASANVRGIFSCKPDPACDVQPVVDPDLPGEFGSAHLTPGNQARPKVSAVGSIDVGYLPGCGGYASEAPTFVVDVDAEAPGSVYFFFRYLTSANNSAGLLVMTPSGDTLCGTGSADVTVPLEPGAYAVWLRSKTPGEAVAAELVGTYLPQ